MKAINTAICSFGMSGYVFHAPFINVHPHFNLVGVWERTSNKAEKIYPNIKTYRSLEEVCGDDDIELVVINTPNITHFEFAKSAILSGKNIVVEKPFTATVAQAEELIQLAKDKQVKISVYQNRRWDSDFTTVKKVIEDGLVGEILELEMHYDRYEPNLSNKIHKETPAEGVNSLFDLGSHLVDQALYLFGMPTSLFADLKIIRPNSKVTDYFDLRLYYPTHKVILKSSYFVKEAIPSFILHGTKGSFLKSRGDIQESVLKVGQVPTEVNWGEESVASQGLLHSEINGVHARRFLPTIPGNYMKYYDGIFQALRYDQPLPVSAEEATNVIRIIEAAMESSHERKVIDL